MKFTELNEIFKKHLVKSDTEVIKTDDFFALEDVTKIKNNLTDLVNYEYIKTPAQLNMLIETVFKIMGYILDKYIKDENLLKTDVILYYKGGNLLARVNKNFNSEMARSITKLLQDNYSEGFSKSDNDFSVIVNKYMVDYDKHFKRINDLVYFSLSVIRDIVLKNKKLYLNFYTLSDQMRQALLVETKDNLKKHGYNATNVKIGEKHDVYIESKDRQNKSSEDDVEIFSSRIGENKKEIISISYNTALKFKKGNELAHFNLIRSKIIFKVDFEDEAKNRDFFGEHIDCSLPKSDDHFFGNLKNNKEYTDYVSKQILFMTEPYKYQCMSLSYLIGDLMRMLFGEMKVWANKKYIKRMRRLFYLLLIDSIIDKKLTGATLSVEIKKFSDRSNPVFHFIKKQGQVKSPEAKKFNDMVDNFVKTNVKILEALKAKLSDFVIKEGSVFDLGS